MFLTYSIKYLIGPPYSKFLVPPLSTLLQRNRFLLNLLPLHLSHTRNKYVRARVRYYSIGVTPSRIIHAHACGYTTPRFQISMEADRRIEGCWRRPIAATDKTSWQRALISFFPFFVFLF